MSGGWWCMPARSIRLACGSSSWTRSVSGMAMCASSRKRSGGGFGSKLEAAVELYAALLTQATGLPVRMVNTREEDFLSGVPRHPMIVELQSAVDAEGRILARKGRVIMDSGAYAAGSPLLVAVAALLAPGPYDIEHHRYRCVRGLYQQSALWRLSRTDRPADDVRGRVAYRCDCPRGSESIRCRYGC